MSNKNFTFFAVILLITIFLTLGVGKYSKGIVAFLSVLLLSMVVINWQKIEPLLLKEGTQ